MRLAASASEPAQVAVAGPLSCGRPRFASVLTLCAAGPTQSLGPPGTLYGPPQSRADNHVGPHAIVKLALRVYDSDEQNRGVAVAG